MCIRDRTSDQQHRAAQPGGFRRHLIDPSRSENHSHTGHLVHKRVDPEFAGAECTAHWRTSFHSRVPALLDALLTSATRSPIVVVAPSGCSGNTHHLDVVSPATTSTPPEDEMLSLIHI